MSFMGLGSDFFETGLKTKSAVFAPWVLAPDILPFKEREQRKIIKEQRKQIYAEAELERAEGEKALQQAEAARRVMMAQQMAAESERASAYRSRLFEEGRRQRLRDAQEDLAHEARQVDVVVDAANAVLVDYAERLDRVAERVGAHYAALEEAQLAASQAVQDAAYLDSYDPFQAEMTVRSALMTVRDQRSRAEGALTQLSILLGAPRGGLRGLGSLTTLAPVAAAGLLVWALTR